MNRLSGLIAQEQNIIYVIRTTYLLIKIIEVFVSLRDFVSDNLNLKLEVEMIKKKLINHDKNIELVFSYLDEMMEKQDKKEERNKIGYKN